LDDECQISGENFRFKAFFQKYKILWIYLQKNRLYGKIWAKTERGYNARFLMQVYNFKGFRHWKNQPRKIQQNGRINFGETADKAINKTTNKAKYTNI
jgi:hypothetical protein